MAAKKVVNVVRYCSIIYPVQLGIMTCLLTRYHHVDADDDHDGRDNLGGSGNNGGGGGGGDPGRSQFRMRL